MEMFNGVKGPLPAALAPWCEGRAIETPVPPGTCTTSTKRNDAGRALGVLCAVRVEWRLNLLLHVLHVLPIVYCCAQKGILGNARRSKGPLLAVLVRGLGNDMIHRCCQVAGAYNRARRARVVAPLRVCRASQREASSKKRRLNQ